MRRALDQTGTVEEALALAARHWIDTRAERRPQGGLGVSPADSEFSGDGHDVGGTCLEERNGPPLPGARPKGAGGAREIPSLRGLDRFDPEAIARELLARAAAEEGRARSLGMAILTLEDDAYPALLREIVDPPPVLYVRGTLEPDDEVRVAIVGSRRASRYGLSVAEGLAGAVARRGITVVSGLARGIDAAAHRGALGAAGRTIAVLGSGLARLYPAEHGPLADRIAASGAIVSEYPLDLGPLPPLFPRRNRIISGLCAGTIVVEAAVASGALGTARLTLDQGRELYALPGSVLSDTSAGTNALLREGTAHVVTQADDVLDELPAVFRLRLGLPASPLMGRPPRGPDTPDGVAALAGPGGQPRPAGNRTPVRPPGHQRPPDRSSSSTEGRPDGEPSSVPPTPDEALVLGHLSHEREISIDELAGLCGLPIPLLLASLSALEIRGLAVTLPGNRVAPGRPPSFDNPGHSPYR